TAKEAADLLLVHTSTIHLMVRRGHLKPYAIGKRLRFKREDIDALLKSYHGRR
ncbi:MAG: Helix-turn-helix domain, partial [Nitrospirae bacterium]|nr:Helix-turn-helix domain [Nitrospirota bacterium]